MHPAAPIQTVQIQVASPQSPRHSRYSCSVKSLGILQIVLAVVSAALGIASAVIWRHYSLASIVSGAWGGLVFYLPAGILGILSVRVSTSRRRVAIATMVMSILAAVMAGTNIIIYSICMTQTVYYYNPYYYISAELGLNSVLLVVSLAELVVSIVASAYCCYVMKEYQPATTTIQYGHPTTNNIYNHQPAAYPGPAVAQAPAMFVTNQAAASSPPPSYGNAVGADIDDTTKGNINLA
ncbi:uncharacterized protein LOC110980884 [Acanthaster planci]|uniref:Uncharacterized protein LOC110980884 n=1 Tax=Acanthaster planci TaxID=133434 RepID=A0A8B7YME7_ACAPL|nr:uncharacterized protein LOC110980884 [Acanthaster planci]